MIEAIKTILNGLVSFMRTNRPNWAQNDPDALDYIKNRQFYEEVKFITEGDIIDYSSTLPEGKYELGKIYIVEVDGVQHQLEFMSSRSGEGNYYVGFNIRPARYNVEVLDSTKPYLFCNIGTASPADGLYSLQVYNITRPAHVRVLQRAIHKIDGKYLPAPTADTAGIIKADAAEITDIRPVRLGADGKLYSSGIPIFTTSGTGSKYTANVPKITKLVDGMLVVMVPHARSTTYAPSLEINNLGEHSICRPISSQTDFISNARYTNWLGADVPVLLMYNSGKWVACTFPKPDADDLQGTVMVDRGGTGLESLTAGSYLVGSGKSYVLLKTPSEVLDDIGAIPAPATAEVGQAIVVKAVDKNGKPTAWEAVEFPEQVRSDYEQNDSSAKDYIKNRPFYDSTETTNISGTSVNIGAGSSVTHSFIPLQVGQEWKVTAVAMTSYEETFIVEENEQGEPYLGTTDAKPVYIRQTETKINSGFINSIGLTALILTCLSGTYTQIVTKKIDPKFLPEIELEAMDKVNPTGTGSFSLNRRPDCVIGDYSFAEGYYTNASGNYSHAENYYTDAPGHYAHAEGFYTIASGINSHAEGNNTKASSQNQHVQGKYNIEDTANTYADIIGNGQYSSRSNAATVDWSGNAWFAGDVYVGSTSGTNKDDGSKKLATEAYVDERACVLMSSTPNSTKKFKITVDDAGTLSAVEVTTS